MNTTHRTAGQLTSDEATVLAHLDTLVGTDADELAAKPEFELWASIRIENALDGLVAAGAATVRTGWYTAA